MWKNYKLCIFVFINALINKVNKNKTGTTPKIQLKIKMMNGKQ